MVQILKENYMSDQNPDDSAEMRALRLKRLRNLANLSREEMCADGQIRKNTLIGWENARFGGLTSSGAAKVITRVTKEGVYCTAEWLLTGKGAQPSVNPLPFVNYPLSNKIDEEIVIAHELSYFRSKNENTVDLLVKDDGMMPVYQPNDYVAGKKRTGSQIKELIGKDCIIETEEGEMFLRNLRQGSNLEQYTLVCTNPKTESTNSVLSNVKIKYAAPVIWHRKKDNF